jgi:hypothetical protein
MYQVYTCIYLIHPVQTSSWILTLARPRTYIRYGPLDDQRLEGRGQSQPTYQIWPTSPSDESSKLTSSTRRWLAFRAYHAYTSIYVISSSKKSSTSPSDESSKLAWKAPPRTPTTPAARWWMRQMNHAQPDQPTKPGRHQADNGWLTR